MLKARLQRLLLALALGAAAIALPACETTSLGGPNAPFPYAEGELTGTIPALPARSVRAAESALEDMGFTHVSSRESTDEGFVQGRTGDNEQIDITFKRAPNDNSHITIRFGAFGDEPLSRALLARIRTYLAS